MLENERQQIANAIIRATSVVVEAVGPVEAFFCVAAGLVKYGGWEIDEAENLAEMMIRGCSKSFS